MAQSTLENQFDAAMIEINTALRRFGEEEMKRAGA